jgi:pentatricopeptide repeat protein
MVNKTNMPVDSVCLGMMTRVCAYTGDKNTAQWLLGKIIQGEYTANVKDCTQLIQSLSKAGDLSSIMKLLDFMRNSSAKESHPNVVTYNCALFACVDAKALKEGKLILSQMLQQGISPSLEVYTTLLKLYSTCGSLSDACDIFTKLRSSYGVDVIGWTTMIGAYVNNGYYKDALKLFADIKRENVIPNDTLLSYLINACKETIALEYGKEIHAYMSQVKPEFSSTLSTALMSMYAKCGSLEDTRKIFTDLLQSSKSIDTATWNTMIGAYGMHGLGIEAIDTFEKMISHGAVPNEKTFTSLLGACSHAGLTDKAHHYWNLMKRWNVTPNGIHYNAYIDALSRAGLFKEVETLIHKMDGHDIVTWTAVLSCCRWTHDVKRAEEAATKALALDPKAAHIRVLLSDIYASVGLHDKAKQVRAEISSSGSYKVPGRTWIELNGVVHTFVAGDERHEKYLEIETALDQLSSEMKASGYIPDTRFSTRDESLSSKEYRLCRHRF